MIEIILNFILIFILVSCLSKMAITERASFDKFKSEPALKNRDIEDLNLEFHAYKAAQQVKWMFFIMGVIYGLTQLFWLTSQFLIMNGLLFGVFYAIKMFKAENLSTLSFTINLASFLSLIVVSQLSIVTYLITCAVVIALIIFKIWIEMENIKI